MSADREVALTDERDIIETIELALQRGYAPSDILDENSPIRDRIRAYLHEPTRAALTSAPPAPADVHETESDSTAVQRPVGEGPFAEWHEGVRWHCIENNDYPATEADCLVWIDKGSKWGPHPYLTKWSMQREDPTGMGGPTIETGYGWDDFYEGEVTHWMLLPPPPTASGNPATAQSNEKDGGDQPKGSRGASPPEPPDDHLREIFLATTIGSDDVKTLQATLALVNELARGVSPIAPPPRACPAEGLMSMDTHPLRSIVEVLHRADGAYDRQKVRLECGHEVWYSGGAIYRARCRHCAHLMFWDEGGFRESEYPSLHRFAAAVRREALEEAALLCDALCSGPTYAAAEEYAAAIRSLIAEAPAR